jgi:hypothetical protein
MKKLKILSAFIMTFATIAAGELWLNLFNEFTYDQSFHGLWYAAIIIVVISLHVMSYNARLGLGRSLAFFAGIILTGAIVTIALNGFFAGFVAILIGGFAAGISYWLLDFWVEPDVHALDNLGAESKHLKKFPEFYREGLQGWMHEQEERRKKAVRQFWIGISIALPVSVMLTGLFDYYRIPDEEFEDEGTLWDWVVATFLFITAAISCGTAMAPRMELQKEVKGLLLGKLLTYFEGLKYINDMGKQGGFSVKRFKKLGLIDDYNREQLKEAFIGTHGHIDFTITEAYIRKVTGSGKNRRVQIIFEGLMITMNFPQPFMGHTVALSDKGRIGNWLKDKSTDLGRVNLVFNKFEDIFEIYSTDQVEARAILTPDMMENLIKLGELFGDKKGRDNVAHKAAKVEMAFYNNELMITIATAHNHFEVGNMDVDMTDTSRIARFAREVGVVYEIIDTLELNRKGEKYNIGEGQTG